MTYYRLISPFQKTKIGVAKLLAVFITVEMIGFGVEANGKVRVEIIEIFLILAHFANKIFISLRDKIAEF